MSKDYYAILKIKRGASLEEIKQAYRKLAVKYHPDKNPNDTNAEERFKEITEAYDVLSDERRKTEYDQQAKTSSSYGHAKRWGRPRTVRDVSKRNSSFNKLNHLFESIFERNRRRREASGPSRGRDITQELSFSFDEAVTGCQKRVKVRYPVECRHCHGTGIPLGMRMHICSNCRGTGTVSVPRGKFLAEQICSYCSGKGQISSDSCSYCQGTGERKKVREIRIKIPPGSKDGTRLRFRGEGQPGVQGGPPGDLYVVIRVDPHRFLRRRGNDVHCEVTIDFQYAILGTTIKITTLDGQANFVIPPGTQPGQVFKLKGLGFPRSSGLGRGDQFVRVQVTIPKSLSPHQRKLIEQF